MGVGLQDVLVWTEPAHILTKYGKRWVRSWVIPQDFLEGFFIFWDKNKLKLKLQGYSIGKNNRGRWCLFEWQIRKSDFRQVFGKDNEKVDPKTIIKESTLPTYEVKNPEGLRPWQVPAVARLVASIQRHGAAIDGSDTGCHAKGQDILMYDGSIKKVEDVVVGDALMGWDGEPRRVLSLKRGREQMVEIIPKKGKTWIVNLNHILTLNLSHLPPNHRTANGYRVGIHDMSVKTWMALNPTTQSRMKLFSVGVDSWKETVQPIPPYLLGVLLGDGGMSSRSVVSVTSNDKEIWDYLNECTKSRGWSLGNTNDDITKRITNAPDLFRHLRNYGLFPISCESKFIPNDYKVCSREQRLQILAGLIDTDGWVSRSGYEFLSKSEKLRNDVSFVARSLGFFVTERTRRCSCKYNGKNVTGTYYKCTIIGDVSVIPLKIKRKIAQPRHMNKNPVLRGFSTKLLGEDNYYGFTLTGDGRYLLDDFTVTHNTGKTYSAVAVARELGMRIAVVCPKAVITPWNKIIKKHFGMTPEFVLNYESVKSGKYKNIGKWVKVSKISTRERFEWTVHKNTLIIFDESHRLKGLNTQNSEIAIAAKQQGYRILCCSATNAINPLELKAVGFILGLYKRGKWTAYLRENDCDQGRFGWQFNGDRTVLAKLHGDLFLERGIRLKREDIPGFPECELIAEAYNIDESSESTIKNLYKEMDRELELLRIKSKNTAEYKINAMVVQMRCLQKAELLKVPLFVDIVEEAIEDGMSVAVFVNFTDTLHALAKRLNTNCLVWGGNKNQEERDKNIEAFQSDRSRVILLNSAAGGAGVSLHDINGTFPRMSVISPSNSVVTFKQVLGRIHRDGSKSKAVQKIVYVANTEEEDVCDRLQSKLHNLDAINDGDLSPTNIF